MSRKSECNIAVIIV